MIKILVLLLFFPFVSVFASSPKVIKIYSTYMGGFAGLRDDGSITAWGDSNYGGNLPESVSNQLVGRRVRDIFSGNCAFAALTEDGLLVTWGGASCGGDSSAVAAKLSSGVTGVHGTTSDGFTTSWGAFAALKSDGSVVTWGKDSMGGDSASVASLIEGGVIKIVANLSNFVALKTDGSVVSWGSDGANNFLSHSQYYGLNRDPSLLLQNDVTDVFSSGNTFVALKSDGQLVGWGNGIDADTLKISQSTRYAKEKIVHIYSTRGAYAALKDDGSVLIWGDSYYGGNAVAIQNQLTSVVGIVSNQGGFAALKDDGTVVSWEGRFQDRPSNGEAWEHGSSDNGRRENIKSVNLNVSGVKVTKIFASDWVFVALKDDGSIVTWGYREYGADTAAATAAIGDNRVTHVSSSYNAYAALNENGSVATWGDSRYGGGHQFRFFRVGKWGCPSCWVTIFVFGPQRGRNGCDLVVSKNRRIYENRAFYFDDDVFPQSRGGNTRT